MRKLLLATLFSVFMTSTGLSQEFVLGPKTFDGYHDFLERHPEFAQPSQPVRLNYEAIKNLLLYVNVRVNQSLVPASDMEIYGVSDYWTIPAPGDRADCEDYALKKIQTLVDAGVPRGALVIVMGISHLANEPHAVAGVVTDQGVYLMDNLLWEVYNLKDNKYLTPMAIQLPGKPHAWLKIDMKETN